MLAISTIFIAKAGKNIAIRMYEESVEDIVFFLIFAIASYAISAFCVIEKTKMNNVIIADYTWSVFNKIHQNLNSEENKKKTTTWISGEAIATLDEISNYIIEALSLYANLILMFIAFIISINFHISIIILLSMAFSLLSTTLLRKLISEKATRVQKAKLSTNLHISSLWDFTLSNSSSHLYASQQKHKEYLNQFSKERLLHAKLEQLISIIPTVISVVIIITMLPSTSKKIEITGALVAILPRILQVLGSVHAIGIINSRFIFFKKKLAELCSFTDSLDKMNFYSLIHHDQIKVTDLITKEQINLDSFLEIIRNDSLKNGRILIEGANGCGKSSSLKLIKSIRESAVRLDSHTNFLSKKYACSAGQNWAAHLDTVLSETYTTILLDEWDANLDESMMQLYDAKIQQMSKTKLIIEVRHKNTQILYEPPNKAEPSSNTHYDNTCEHNSDDGCITKQL